MDSPKLCIHRPRLVTELQQKFSQSRVVLVQAPAGFGKSTLVKQFLHPGKNPYFRYTITPADRDPDLIINALSRRIIQIYPNASQYIGYLHNSSNSSYISWQAKCADILHALATVCHEKFFLVFDDCHAAENNPEFVNFLTFLIKKLPANVFLLLSARNHTAPFLSRYLLHDEIGFIPHSELYFTIDEIRHFFSECYFIDTHPEQIRKIKKLCSGWPLGIHLIAKHLNQKPSDINFDNIELLQNNDLTHYLATEMIGHLAEDKKQFLIRTALFEVFSTSMCEEILEEKNTLQKINYLFDQGLLVRKQGSHGYWFEHHGLFRKYFYSRLQHSDTPANISKLHEMAGLYFASRDLPLKSIDHYVQGELYGKAETVLEKNLKNLMAGTPAAQILKITGLFPPLHKARKPIISLARGWALFLIGDWRNALGSLQDAVNLSQEEKYLHIRIISIQLIAGLYYGLDEYGKLESFLKKWEQKIPSPHLARPETLCLLALGLSQVGRMDHAEAVWQQIQNLSIVRKTPRLAANINAVKSINNGLLRGRIQEINQVVENDLKDMKHSSPGLYARALGYFSTIKYVQGLFDQCNDLTSQAIAACKETNQAFASTPLLLLQAINALDSGNIDIAKQALKEFRENISKPAMPGNIGKSNIWKEYLYYGALAGIAERSGNVKQFLYHAETALQMVNQKESFLDVYLLYAFLAPRFASLGKPKKAKELLEHLDSFLAPIDTPYFKAHTRLMTAYILYEQNQKNAACTWLEKSIDTAQKNQYEFLFLYKKTNISKKLRPLLLEQEKNFDFIAKILIRMGPTGCNDLCNLLKTAPPEKKISIIQALAANECQHTEKNLAACTRDKNPEVKKTAMAAVQKLRTLPPLPLTVQTFGTYMLKIGDRQVKPGDWKRKMVISLFQYFLMHAGKPITQEKLIDVFMPEQNPQKATTHIQTLVSNLRQILEPGLPSKQISKYIKAGKGTYTFLLPKNSYVDAFEFDRLMVNARQAEKNKDYYKAFNSYQSALNIYSGDFLTDFPYDEWTESYRRRYSEQYENILYKLAQHYFNRGEHASCENHLQTLIARNPLEEKAYLLLMKCYAAREDRTKAVKVYLQCQTILKEELGILPNDELRRLYGRIRLFH